MYGHTHAARMAVLMALLVPALAACGTTPPSSQATTPVPAAVTAIPPTTAPATADVTTAPAITAAPEPTSGPPATTAPEAAGGGKILHIHQYAYPDTIDPQKMSVTNEVAVANLVFEGLTRLDKQLKSVPAAAEKWEFNAAGDEITFTLRQGLTYSDGSPLTAENFRYAVLRTCDPRTAGQYQAILFDVAGCADFASTPVTDTAKLDAARDAVGAAAADEHTLRVKLTHPAPYFPYIAGLWVMFPARQDLIEAGGDAWWQHAENLVGNGPFRITALNEDQNVEFAANEKYWGGRPKLDGIEMIYQTDATVALAAYKAGQIDIMSPDPSDIPAIKGDAVLSKELMSYPVASTFQLQFNLNRAPFDDPKVREAFAYAFDRATFCEQIMSGTCIPTLSWIPAGVAGHIETDKFAYDPEKAKAALAASSYGGANGLPEIKYTYNASNPSEQPRAEWMAGMYRDALGVEVALDPVEIKTLISLSKSNETYPQATMGGWIQDYPDPQNWMSVYWQSQAMFAQNLAYKNEKLDDLLARADVELDPAKRIPLYEQAGQILVDDQPGVFIANSAGVKLVKPFVTGYDITASDFEWPGQWASLLAVDITR